MTSSPLASTLLAMSEAGVAALTRIGVAAVSRAGGSVRIVAGRALSGATNEKISARIRNSRFTLTPYLFGDELEDSIFCTSRCEYVRQIYHKDHTDTGVSQSPCFYESECLWVSPSATSVRCL